MSFRVPRFSRSVRRRCRDTATHRAAEMMGSPAPGYSSAQALKAMEEVMATMPSNVGYEWSGLTLQEKKSEGQAPIIFAMALVFVFLLLAAQYESWSLPFAVLLSVCYVFIQQFTDRKEEKAAAVKAES